MIQVLYMYFTHFTFNAKWPRKREVLLTAIKAFPHVSILKYYKHFMAYLGFGWGVSTSNFLPPALPNNLCILKISGGKGPPA